MSREISYKMYRALYIVSLTLAVSLPVISQTQEKVVNDQARINKENSAAEHRISGTVTMKTDNQPVVKTKIEMRGTNNLAGGALLFVSKTFTDEQGRWKLDNVPDGNYVVLVDPTVTLLPVKTKNGQVEEIISGVTAKFVAQTFEVKMAGTDIDNLTIQVIKGGRITGKVTMYGSEPIPEGLIVLPEQTIKFGRSPLRFAPVNPDGTFTLDAVPTGEIVLKAVVFGKPKEYQMKSATVNDKDLLRQTINIENNSEVKDVNIVFAKVIDK